MECIVTVDEVNADRQATRATLAVDTFTYTTAAGEQTVEPGTVILAQRTDDGHAFSKDGSIISDAALVRVLRLLFEMPSGDPLVHDMYATADTRKPGESAPLHPEVIVADLAADGVTADAQNVTGNLLVRATAEHEGMACHEYVGTVAVAGMTFARELVPDGLNLESAEFKFAMRLLVPVDERLPVAMMEAESEQRIRGRGRMGSDLVLVEASQVSKRQMRRSYQRL
jgi:hypothetical protein